MPVSTSCPVPLRGDETDLFTRYSRRVRAAVRRAVRTDDATIEDACAFAWLQLIRNQPRRESVYPWLCKVAIREAWRLNSWHSRDLELTAPDAVLGGFDHIEISMAARDALATLAALPERQRACVALSASGWSYDEIAARSGTTFTNVNRHLARGRRRLRATRAADASLA